ncbi:unnamed protein product [Dovyalis caffra]|uniref:Golgi apparatus membrane protein TVP23 n=1 Tax=Dovyalis caffra TaxID=77055 RepID=A0AAV1SAK1_9ROSI|nr:unnamed protein product [Dovyalis caffra]
MSHVFVDGIQHPSSLGYLEESTSTWNGDIVKYKALKTGVFKALVPRIRLVSWRRIQAYAMVSYGRIKVIHLGERSESSQMDFAQAAALAFYILSALFFDSFVIIFVVTVLLAALDFWVVKNVSGRILVGLRWWNEINEQGESVWKFECLDQQSLARMNKEDSWLFWWTLYLSAAAWVILGIFSVIRLEADYVLVVAVCASLSIANIVGFTKCRKDAKKQIQGFASQAITSHFTSTIRSALSAV